MGKRGKTSKKLPNKRVRNQQKRDEQKGIDYWFVSNVQSIIDRHDEGLLNFEQSLELIRDLVMNL